MRFLYPNTENSNKGEKDMGWDIRLIENSQPVVVAEFMYGSNVMIGHFVEEDPNDKNRWIGKGGYFLRAGGPEVEKYIQLRNEWYQNNPYPYASQQVFELIRGGPVQEETLTLVVTGRTEAVLTLTFNYRKFFNFDQLHGMKALDSIPLLTEAVQVLGTERSRGLYYDSDENVIGPVVWLYWEEEMGNVGYACDLLLGWAAMNPHAVWEVTA
jgi:hypothetical protein